MGDTHGAVEGADFQRLEYDPVSGNYILHLSQTLGAPGTVSFTYSPSPSNPATGYYYYANNSNFRSYKDSSTGPYQPSELFLYKIGSDNTEIALTYVSFGVQINNPFSNSLAPYTISGRATFFIYGVPTLATGVPKTGTASYNGVVWGWGTTPSVGSIASGTYDIHGTSSLTANFATSSVTTSLTYSGTLIPYTVGIVAGIPTTTISGTGTIGSPGFQSSISTGGEAGTFYGTLAGAGGTGVFTGRFYGPTAQEFGYNFEWAAGADRVAGVAFGKQ